MYVKIQYYKSGGFYAGGKYAYLTRLPLEVGDKVIAPTAREPRQKGIVTDVFVEPPAFECREITEYDPDGLVVRVE